jgi:hypothetical protein
VSEELEDESHGEELEDEPQREGKSVEALMQASKPAVAQGIFRYMSL